MKLWSCRWYWCRCCDRCICCFCHILFANFMATIAFIVPENYIYALRFSLNFTLHLMKTFLFSVLTHAILFVFILFFSQTLQPLRRLPHQSKWFRKMSATVEPRKKVKKISNTDRWPQIRFQPNLQQIIFRIDFKRRHWATKLAATIETFSSFLNIFSI